jgi:predicted amidohydrolase
VTQKHSSQQDALFSIDRSGGQIDAGPVRAGWSRFRIDWPAYDEFRPKMSDDRRVTLGLFQFAPQDRSASENAAFIADALGDISDATIVLPEFFLGSYSAYRQDILERGRINEILSPLRVLSRDNRLRLVGSLPVHKSGHEANNVVIVQNGTTRFTVQDKERLYGQEENDFRPGASRGKLAVGEGLWASIQVCMDIVDPLPARRAVADGARAILAPSAVSVDFLRTIHNARALENQVVSVFCNRVGEDVDGIVYLGRSAIFMPDGVALSASSKKDELLTANVDMDYVIGFAKKFGPGICPEP